MSFRLPALAVLSALTLAACSDNTPPTAPLARLPKPALAIDAGLACNAATMPVIECQALVALYNSTNGPGWTDNTGWGTDPNPCHWAWVACTEADQGSVRDLFLNLNGLSGTIPPELGNLTEATLIDLARNQLTGSIPSALGGLSAVSWLSLADNQLTGPIPAALGDLPSVQRLFLHDNQLSGTIPETLAQLTQLQHLALQGNQLAGVVPVLVAALGESLPSGCDLRPGNPELFMPDVQTYRTADQDGDGTICGLGFVTAEDIGEDTVDEIDDLVPGTLNGGQANALKTKIENAMAKAANGQYAAAINQMQSFLSQLGDMVANGTVTPAQAAPFIDQAESLIAIWTGML